MKKPKEIPFCAEWRKYDKPGTVTYRTLLFNASGTMMAQEHVTYCQTSVPELRGFRFSELRKLPCPIAKESLGKWQQWDEPTKEKNQ